jgi:hypothetical protein
MSIQPDVIRRSWDCFLVTHDGKTKDTGTRQMNIKTSSSRDCDANQRNISGIDLPGDKDIFAGTRQGHLHAQSLSVDEISRFGVYIFVRRRKV